MPTIWYFVMSSDLQTGLTPEFDGVFLGHNPLRCYRLVVIRNDFVGFYRPTALDAETILANSEVS